ncbi:hypothetical protein D5086_013521 [Populus alba]|uniref:Uncharacterized protein n=2 Tax=Populus alba TaxID=43335 RepID=A0A4U5PQH2_POPAL|nr:hypothetical protein D5086_0000189770 [Populus alba]
MGEIAEGEFEANIESSVKISMAILGKNKILPLLGKSKGSSGHRLLKYIALYLPRNDRCTCKECEVLSGIFGNAFWHENREWQSQRCIFLETSYLANKYMKLHQPGFRHERAVVDGFGHSDLLIGEKSHEKVFPHIISHIRLAEQEGNDLTPRKKEGQQRGFGLG